MKNNRRAAREFCDSIELEFRESVAPASGMSYGGRIAIRPGRAPAEEFSILVYELLHKAERHTATAKTHWRTVCDVCQMGVS